MRQHKNNLLSVAALDSSGGAGLNRDIQVAAHFGYQAQVCVTGITLQSPGGVERIFPTGLDLFREQTRFLRSAASGGYIKIGALCDISQVDVLTVFLRRAKPAAIVLDPVLMPTQGLGFIVDVDLERYKKLLSCVDYITPNWDELTALSGIKANDFESAVKAAQSILDKYRCTVLVKSGHSTENKTFEALVSAQGIRTFPKTLENWEYTHGTGCAFSTSFTCLLADSHDPVAAFQKATDFVSKLYGRING